MIGLKINRDFSNKLEGRFRPAINARAIRDSDAVSSLEVGESRATWNQYRSLLNNNVYSGYANISRDALPESAPTSSPKRGTWVARLIAHVASPDLLSHAFATTQAAATFRDVIIFCAALPNDLLLPKVSAAEGGEISLQWKQNGKRAIADFEGDGKFGYALFIEGRFVPGQYDVETTAEIPADLLSYLKKMI